MKPHVCITGGTGFLGRYLVREFLDAGYEVHVLCRESSDRGGLEGLAVDFYAAELRDEERVQEALLSIRARIGEAPLWLVHNAALIGYAHKDRERLFETNVRGVKNILQASQEAGVVRLVHVSSIVTMGFAQGGVSRVESDRCNAAGLNVDYVDSKLAGEQCALQSPRDLQVRVVNPGAIFGPVQANSNSARFLQGMAQGKIGSWAPPGGMAVVGVRDCATGVRLALELGEAGQRYLLTESYLSSRELFAAVGQRLLGKDPVRGTLPPWIWRILGGGLSMVSAVREPQLTTPQAMRMLGVPFDARGDRARRELGWQPRPFGEVLDWTLREMRSMGLLPGRQPRATNPNP